MMTILTIASKQNERFLRTPVAPLAMATLNKKELRETIRDMRETMVAAQGIGLAANQVGLSIRLFVALVESKFYAIINPEIVKQSKEVLDMEEGCLSIPGIYGDVPRPAEIVLSGYDKNGKRVKIKASGLRARVFQHETDHLNGVLFIDKAKNLHEYHPEQK
jgi:peptide deformylase